MTAALALHGAGRKLAPEGRLHGAPLGGFWMHVGDPEARELAEAKLAAAGGK